MTQQEIEELARHRKVPSWVIKLVADAVAVEREACAQVCEEYENDMGYGQPQKCADAIRARGNK